MIRGCWLLCLATARTLQRQARADLGKAARPGVLLHLPRGTGQTPRRPLSPPPNPAPLTSPPLPSPPLATAGLRPVPGGAVHRCQGLRRHQRQDPAGPSDRLLQRLWRRLCVPGALCLRRRRRRHHAGPRGGVLPAGALGAACAGVGAGRAQLWVLDAPDGRACCCVRWGCAGCAECCAVSCLLAACDRRGEPLCAVCLVLGAPAVPAPTALNCLHLPASRWCVSPQAASPCILTPTAPPTAGGCG